MKSRLMMAGGLLAACAMLAGCAQDGRIVAVDQATSSAVMFSGEPGASCDILWRWNPAEDPALGYTNLVEAAYLPETLSLKVVRRWDYRTAAGDAFGHDLLSDGSGGYYFTNHTGVWRIDPETGAITSVLAHGNAKSFSRDAEKGDVLAIPTERWWADHVTVIAPDGAARTVGPFPGAKFYKARWVER